MEKRTPGSPLSDAELQQRRDAARARWAARGAAAGVAAAAVGMHMQRSAAAEQLVAAHGETVGAEIDRHNARVKSLQGRLASGLRTVRRQWPVPTYRAVLRRDMRDLHRQAHGLPKVWDDNEGLYRPADPVAEGLALAEMRGKQAEHDQLDDATPPQTIKRRATIVRAAEPHTRILRSRGGQVRSDLSATERAELAAAKAQHDDRVTALRSALEEAQGADAWAEAMNIQRALDRTQFRVPKRFRAPRSKTVEVTPEAAQVHVRAGGKVRIQGTPDNEGLARIRRGLKERVENFISVKEAAEGARHAEGMASAGAQFVARRSSILRFVPRGRAARIGVLGAGAVIGGLGGYFAAKSRKLSKAADPDAPEFDGAEQVRGDAAEGVASDSAKQPEETMMDRLAATFRKWKDDASALLSVREASLYTTMLTDLQTAMEPIGDAMRGGIEAPLQVVQPQEDGKERALSYSFSARNPKMEDFISAYRQDRIVELAREQRDAIRTLLINAAKTGASPDEMARQIRQTIGLTTTQADHVLSYRRALELGSPDALTRALRDRRYDRTVAAAVAGGKGLTDEQIDTMTDAYQRRYLAYRAMTVARTEGLMAANNGHAAALEALVGENPDYTVVKTWIATDDDKTRHDHKALNGVSVVGMHTPFTVEHKSGEIDSVMWPHDQDAPARQVINCRCTFKTQLVPRRLVASMGPAAVDFPKPETEPV